MKQRKIIGRIAHFFLPFSINMALLNAIHILLFLDLLFISIILLVIWASIGYGWEYKLQMKIANKFQFLKWDPNPDPIALLALIIGSILSSILFFIL
jgi:hypothetical protein